MPVLTGAVLFVGHILVTLTGTGFGSFAGALVLLGVAWNLMYIGGRTLLARTYTPAERARAQAINGTTNFAVGLTCSFNAGGLLEALGWQTMKLALVPVAVAGVLDGGTGEVALGGSRLNRFMKEVENVTGQVGEGEAMTPAEEVVGARAGAAVPAESEVVIEGEVETGLGADGTAQQAPPQMDADPWRALAQTGTQLVSALAAANDPAASAHPWIERDPATGVRNLKLPLPPPETARRLADAFSMLADALRGKG